MYNVLLFFSFFESVIGFNIMTASVMHFRKPVKKRIILGFLVMLFGISILSYTIYTYGVDSMDKSAILAILGIEVCWFLICSDDNFFVSLFNFFTFVNIYVSISYISDMLTIYNNPITYLIEYIIIRAVMYSVVSILLFKFVRPRFRYLVDTLDYEWRTAVLVPFMFLILQIFLLYYPKPYWYWNSDNWYKNILIVVYILFLTVYYLLHVQSNAIVEKYLLEKKQLLMAQQEKLWEIEIDRQKSVSNLAFQQRHDMHHNNSVMMNMLQNGNIEELKNYIKSYDASLDIKTSKFFSVHPIINSILNSYAKMSDAEGIDIIFNINVPETIGIDNIDLTCILGNILENAFEGCLRLSNDIKKEIVLDIKFSDDMLKIQLENTCRKDIEFHFDFPVTQKIGGGTGTKSIIYTAEKYGGTTRFASSDGKFITQVVLNAK